MLTTLLIMALGATCVTSFLDPDKGYSTLLVGGDNITAFISSEYTSSKEHGTVISPQRSSLCLKDIHASLVSHDLRVWYTTKSDSAHYYTTTTSALSEGRLVPLLAEGKAGQISGMLSLGSATGKQAKPVSSLISVDEHGALLLLQQDPRSGVWQQFPFYHVSTTNVIELKGYSLRFHAKASSESNPGPGSDQVLIPSSWLRVASSGVIRCIIDGRSACLAPAPKWFQTDSQGVLNVVFATKDASCYKVLIDAFRPANASEDSSEVRWLNAPVLDPSRKLIPKLEFVNSKDDLRTAKTQTGASLISADATDEDVGKAAAAIVLLRE